MSYHWKLEITSVSDPKNTSFTQEKTIIDIDRIHANDLVYYMNDDGTVDLGYLNQKYGVMPGFSENNRISNYKIIISGKVIKIPKTIREMFCDDMIYSRPNSEMDNDSLDPDQDHLQQVYPEPSYLDNIRHYSQDYEDSVNYEEDYPEDYEEENYEEDYQEDYEEENYEEDYQEDNEEETYNQNLEDQDSKNDKDNHENLITPQDVVLNGNSGNNFEFVYNSWN